MESLSAVGYTIQNDCSNNNRNANMIGSAIMMFFSVQNELVEMANLEKQNLDNNELQSKKQELAAKLMDKYKKNEERIIYVARNAQIMMIQSKIDLALDTLFDNERNDNV